MHGKAGVIRSNDARKFDKLSNLAFVHTCEAFLDFQHEYFAVNRCEYVYIGVSVALLRFVDIERWCEQERPRCSVGQAAEGPGDGPLRR
jgi:hypothetical protein